MDVRNKFDKILYLYSMLMVRLQWLPSTQTPNMLRQFFARENFLLYLFFFFFHARMDVKTECTPTIGKIRGATEATDQLRTPSLAIFL